MANYQFNIISLIIFSAQFRGYSSVGTETTNNKPDNREQIDFGYETTTRPVDPEVLSFYWLRDFSLQFQARLPWSTRPESVARRSIEPIHRWLPQYN